MFTSGELLSWAHTVQLVENYLLGGPCSMTWGMWEVTHKLVWNLEVEEEDAWKTQAQMDGIKMDLKNSVFALEVGSLK